MKDINDRVTFSPEEGGGSTDQGAGDQGGNDQNNGGSVHGWKAGLPDDLKNHEFIKDHAKVGDSIREFVALKQEAGSMLRVPGENATDAERAAFYKAVGRPETPDAYSLKKPEGMPEGMPYNEASEKMFKDYFHELGLSDAQAVKLWGKYHETAIQGFTAQAKADADAAQKAMDTLQAEWTGDTFKINSELAHRAFMRTFDKPEQIEEAKAFLETTKVGGVALGDHPMFLRVFAKIGATISDDQANAGRNSGGQDNSDEAKAKARFPNTKFAGGQ